MFGAADAAGSLIGATLWPRLPGPLAAVPWLTAVYGLYLLAVTGAARRRLELSRGRGRAAASRIPPGAVVVAVAAALSVDNLASPAHAAAAATAIAVNGCLSAALAFVGLAMGSAIARRLPDGPRGLWVGAGLVGAACLAVLA